MGSVDNSTYIIQAIVMQKVVDFNEPERYKK